MWALKVYKELKTDELLEHLFEGVSLFNNKFVFDSKYFIKNWTFNNESVNSNTSYYDRCNDVEKVI